LKRVKRRRFSGCVCEQIVYSVAESCDPKKAKAPRPRFKDEAERAAHREKISRKKFQRIVNSFGPESLYSTLTLDNEDEVHTFNEAKKLRDNFVRKVRRHFPEAKLVIVMGRGQHTDRIHFHMVSENVPKVEIQRLWNYGDVVRIAQMRAHNFYGGVDHGRDYSGLADYLFDHWTPEQGGHHWKQTRNVREPEPEAPVEVRREYSVEKPPKAPKGFFLVEAAGNQYGYFYFKYVKIPEPYQRWKNRTNV
jgi:hypothetical protein